MPPPLVVPIDEAVLLAALRRRDEQAFALLFETYADRLFRLAIGVLGCAMDAEDVVQLTFLSAFEALDRFDARSSLGTWLYRIAYNHALMRLRRQRPSSPLPDADDVLLLPAVLIDWSDLPEQVLLSNEAQQVLLAAIRQLPLTLRAPCILRDIEGLSTAEAAAVLGIGQGALKVRLHRARLAVREAVSVYFSERIRILEHPDDL